jgi:SAM-dependent methyltransferase
MNNIDHQVVLSFGDEWSRFDQSGLPKKDARRLFEDYFAIFPWKHLPQDAEGFDMGCGSGRWASFVSPRVRLLHCIDPSGALEVARKNLSGFGNVKFHSGSVDSPDLPISSQDFGYSLGVLHHVPDTAAGIRSCVSLLKPGAPLLLYLYYAFDNRSIGYRAIWRITDLMRRLIIRLPPRLKHRATDILAILVYFPLARMCLLLERFGISVDSVPLSAYRHLSFYTMRTDSRDRFGTPLEQRFTRDQISEMCTSAGLVDLSFSPQAPYWCVVGFKAG